MKTSFFLATICLISLSAFVVYSRFDVNRGRTSISISEDETIYQLEAAYNENNTRQVEGYINNCISPNRLGNSEHDYLDITTSLTDGTVFYIKESPGKLKIELNKKKNSVASYNRFKKMFEGLKSVISH